jgi:hypothetical protein
VFVWRSLFSQTKLLAVSISSTSDSVGSLWESSKLCMKHFLEWTPELLEEDIDAMNELRELVHRATSERWHPQTVST